MADSWAPQSFNVSAPCGFLDATCSRESNNTVDNTPSNFVNTFVAAAERPVLGEQVVHGGDALTTKKLPPNSEELKES